MKNRLSCVFGTRSMRFNFVGAIGIGPSWIVRAGLREQQFRRFGRQQTKRIRDQGFQPAIMGVRCPRL